MLAVCSPFVKNTGGYSRQKVSLIDGFGRRHCHGPYTLRTTFNLNVSLSSRHTANTGPSIPCVHFCFAFFAPLSASESFAS
jgi:hypothetical protein